jgi:hypothetical protein
MYNFEDQVLIGTVLGGSSLVKPPKGKNYYLSMRSQNSEWLEYKMLEMPSFFTNVKFHKYGNTHRCNSCCHQKLTYFYNELYENKKRKIKMETLDLLTDTALAVWFLDSGSKTGRSKKNAYINTTKFGSEGSETILKYFNEIGIPCNINYDGDRLKVLFTVKGTEIFLKTTAHRFPTFMYHRI